MVQNKYFLLLSFINIIFILSYCLVLKAVVLQIFVEDVIQKNIGSFVE